METFLEVALSIFIAVAGLSWIIRLVIYFGYRYRDGRAGKDNPYEKKETMGLPKGAIRTFLALAFTTIALLAMLGRPELIEEADKKWILLELGAIVTFYFGSKSLEAFIDSRAKVKAIDKAQTTDDALKTFKTVEDREDKEENKNTK